MYLTHMPNNQFAWSMADIDQSNMGHNWSYQAATDIDLRDKPDIQHCHSQQLQYQDHIRNMLSVLSLQYKTQPDISHS